MIRNEGQDEPPSIRDYHRRTFHTLAAYARGPEALDWSGQPDPFRRFDGAPLLMLPFRDDNLPAPAYAELFEAGAVAPAPLNLNGVAALLELSLAISAWKAFGPDRWALRCNPSSGNLHPTEGYVVATGVEGLADGIHHYRPDEHALEQRAAVNLTGGPRLIVGLSSILWREGWKYGERAFRYCQLDIGHAVGALSFAAATLGWQVRMLDHYGSAKTATLLGLDQAASFADAEPEEAELLLEIGPSLNEGEIPNEWFTLAREAEWLGRANRLDSHPYGSWPLLAEAAKSSRFSDTEARPDAQATEPRLTTVETRSDAAALIRQRRSAQAFDPRPLLPRDDFFRLLDAALPHPGTAPWPVNSDAPHTHLLLFVHRVDGLRQGLYALPRSPEGERLMRREFRDDFLWEPVADAPMPLFALVHADCRRAAGTLSCHQPIAADSAFAVSMLGEFDGMLGDVTSDEAGYRQLLIEAGMIGQALYLEAEALGVRGTGIGCYFDDAVHETLGLEGSALQAVYHFTVGRPLVDERIRTLPPYARMKDRSA